MTTQTLKQPAIALVDDDMHSARLLTRMLAAHGGPNVDWMPDPEAATRQLAEIAATAPAARPMTIVDLKTSSTATRDFVARLKQAVPDLLVVAMAPSLDRSSRDSLLEAGAAAVFERHADVSLYRAEAAAIVAFWVRRQRLDAVGS